MADQYSHVYLLQQVNCSRRNTISRENQPPTAFSWANILLGSSQKDPVPFRCALAIGRNGATRGGGGGLRGGAIEYGGRYMQHARIYKLLLTGAHLP